MMLLRKIDEDDLLRLFAWRNDPKVRTFTRQNDTLSWRQHQEWFNWQGETTNVRMYILEDAYHADLGVCGLTSIDWINRRAEFSFYLSPENQGKGMAAAGLRTLFNHGFDILNLNLIWGETFGFNKAAMHIFKKIGLIEEGIRQSFYYRDGAYVDAILYSITAQQWRAIY